MMDIEKQKNLLLLLKEGEGDAFSKIYDVYWDKLYYLAYQKLNNKEAAGGIEIRAADMESSLAWKNGDFIFNNEELHNIMNKLERWYDIQVEYNGSIVPRRFSGAISRSKNLSEVLKIMEFIGKVTFKIAGRRVLVMM